MTKNSLKLKINPVLDSLVPKLTPEDEQSLDESIKENGQWEGYPLTVAPDGDICDGMNRYRKFLKYKVEVKYVIDKSLKTLEDKKIFVIKNLMSRRHLNNWQRGLLGIQLMELVEHQSGKKSLNVVDQVPGLKIRTFDKIIKINKVASAEIKKKLDSGTISVNNAYVLVTKKDRNLPKVELPTDQHDVLLCDVPIRYDFNGGSGKAENHYDTMTVEDLCDMKIPAADNAIIFFWIPASNLLYGIQILTAWGFSIEKRPHFIWKKNKSFIGSWMHTNHELLLIGVKGKMPTPAKIFPSVIEADVTAHSEKPKIVYSMIEEMYPSSKTVKRKYLELFARSSREGWTSHGNEVKESFSEFCKRESKNLKPEKEVEYVEPTSKKESPIDKLRKMKK